MKKLLGVVKEASLPGLWSRGVALSRASAVSLTADQGDEIVLRVKSAGRPVAATVVLYPEDAEWTCDCGSRADPCEHVTAATIALYQSRTDVESPGKSLREAPEAPRLHYDLTIARHQLRVERFVVSPDGQRKRLGASLASLLARGVCPFEPTQDDVLVDRILSATPRGNLDSRQVGKILAALADARSVALDGDPVKTSGEPVKPVAHVVDQGDQVVLRISADPRVERVVAPGLVMADGLLRPIGEVDLGGSRLERLPLERSVSVSESAELVERMLPELSKRIEVHVLSTRLPTVSRSLTPRIDLSLAHHGHALSVLPTLVYGDPPVARVDGDKLVLLGREVPKRDRDREHALCQRLLSELNLALGRRVDFNGPDAARFADKLRSFSDTGGESDLGDLAVVSNALIPDFTVYDDDFTIRFESPAAAGDQPAGFADPRAVLEAWRQGLSLVPLVDGGWAPLPTDWLNRFGEQLENLLDARGDRQGLPLHALPGLAELSAALDQPPPAALDRIAPLLEDFESIPAPKLPADLAATLRPYQATGIAWLSFLRDLGLGAVLADDMGLGKTLQTLAALEGKTLVVCPKSVLFNWQSEIEKFRPSLSCSVYHGPTRALDREADVVLTTYAVLRLDVDELALVHWSQVVLDEAQAIKNPQSQTARAAYRLNGSFRVALSGTPIENRLEELWSIFHFTHPGLLGGRSGFERRFAGPIESGNERARIALRRLTKPFLLRRLKSVVARDLPPRSDVVLSIELESEERQVYDAVTAATRERVVEQLQHGGGVMQALEALLRMRQAACHSALVPGQRAESSSKIQALLDALGDTVADGHKSLVFSQWTSFLDLIEPHLVDLDVRFARLDGSTRDRAAVVNAFQSDAGPPVLLASLKAGGTGLNLTAADHVFIMDPWYNPAAEEQAADRAHRIGQTRPVMVYRLVARDTVEEGIVRLQKKKRHLADGALEGADLAASVTRDDLLELLN